MRTRVSPWLLAMLLSLLPSLSFAYEFVPTDTEFQGWPIFCRAKYVETPIGAASRFARMVSKVDSQNGLEAVGADVYLHVHHYCSGAALVGRGKRETDPAQKKFLFTTAIGDLTYVAARIPHDSRIYPNVLFSLAQAYNGLGDRTEALSTLNDAIDNSPDNPGSYIALGLFLRDSKDLAGARNVLERGAEAAGDTSAELNYDLALVLLELNEKEQATRYARKAYDLGYPLPGLRNKLIRMGLWDQSPDVAHE